MRLDRAIAELASAEAALRSCNAELAEAEADAYSRGALRPTTRLAAAKSARLSAVTRLRNVQAALAAARVRERAENVDASKTRNNMLIRAMHVLVDADTRRRIEELADELEDSLDENGTYVVPAKYRGVRA